MVVGGSSVQGHGQPRAVRGSWRGVYGVRVVRAAGALAQCIWKGPEGDARGGFAHTSCGPLRLLYFLFCLAQHHRGCSLDAGGV